MRFTHILAFITLLSAASAVHGDDADRLIVSAQAASVKIGSQASDRHMISLPALEFPLSLEATCVGAAVAESISISIADTRITYSGTDLDMVASMASISTTFQVPGRQISAIAIERFCTGDADDAVNTLLIPAALTAHISLRCASENRQSIRYVSQPLEIRLLCNSGSDARSTPPSNQDSSLDSL